MQRANSLIGLITIAWIGLTTSVGFAQKPAPAAPRPATAAPRAPRAAPTTPKPTPKPAATTTATADHNAVVKRYCVTCHNDTRKTGGLSLASFDVTQAARNAEVAERVVRKLQAGMMPPPGSSRPDPATHAALVSALETRIDTAAAARPNPGGRVFQRLN